MPAGGTDLPPASRAIELWGLALQSRCRLHRVPPTQQDRKPDPPFGGTRAQNGRATSHDSEARGVSGEKASATGHQETPNAEEAEKNREVLKARETRLCKTSPPLPTSAFCLFLLTQTSALTPRPFPKRLFCPL